MLLAVRTAPASEKVMAPAAAVAVSHVAPLSSDTLTTSPAPSGPLKVPEMVWVATLVTKSVVLDPVSDEKATVLTSRQQKDCDVMFAQPGEPEGQLIVHLADGRGPGDHSGRGAGEIDKDITVANH